MLLRSAIISNALLNQDQLELLANREHVHLLPDGCFSLGCLNAAKIDAFAQAVDNVVRYPHGVPAPEPVPEPEPEIVPSPEPTPEPEGEPEPQPEPEEPEQEEQQQLEGQVSEMPENDQRVAEVNREAESGPGTAGESVQDKESTEPMEQDHEHGTATHATEEFGYSIPNEELAHAAAVIEAAWQAQLLAGAEEDVA